MIVSLAPISRAQSSLACEPAVAITRAPASAAIWTAGSQAKLDWAREMGASETINYREENLTEQVIAMTDGAGADLFIEHVGGDRFMESLRSLRPGGRLVTCGAHAGETPEIDVIEVFRNEWEVLGSRIGTPAEMRLTMDLLGAGRLKAAVHAAIPLAQAPSAHRIIEQREQTGKVILVP